MQRILFILAFVFCCVFKTHASHLIAGNIGYELISYDTVAGLATYEVNLITYQDCNSPYWGTGFPEPTVEIGIYGGVENPNGNMNAVRVINLSIQSQAHVVPELGVNCNIGLTTCIYLVEYSGQVILPLNNSGYHFIYERCCRPPGILNINQSGDQGFTYRAWAAPLGTNAGGIQNSSPIFTDTLIAYICVGDTSFLKNDALDPDGDSLVYELLTPMRGYTGNGQGGNPPPNYTYGSGYTWPSPDVTWAPGYSLNNMFGMAGYASISSSSGLTYFSAGLVGLYVASVKISEYRYGQLIGVSRRDIQLLAINCPSNDAPVQSFFSSTVNTIVGDTFYVEAGDTLCVDLSYEDFDGDYINYTRTGNIFNPSVTSPIATGQFIRHSASKASFQMCWETDCNQYREDPFFFRIEVVDDGCPPKLIIEEYTIFITKPPSDSISFTGPDTLCFTDSALAQYQLDFIPAIGNYEWNVTGGSISTFGNEAELSFDANQAVLTVNALSDNGCVIASDQMDIFYGYPLSASAGPDTSICNGVDINLGDDGISSSGAGYSYSWTPANAVTNSSSLVTTTNIDTNTTLTLTVQDYLGCSETDEVILVSMPNPELEVSNDTTICFGQGAQLWAVGTDSLYWSPGIWLNNRYINDPRSKPDSTITYYAITTDTNGCVTQKPVTIFVQEEHEFSLNISELVFIGQDVTLEVENDQGLLVEWYLNGDKYCENCSEVERDFMTNQNIELFISDTNACFYYDTAFTLEVLDEFNVTIPNAFTPNNDGKNDLFYPVTFGIEELIRFMIFDRWGNLIFETNNLDEGWDGYHKGELMPCNQVFAYRTIVKRYNGDEHEYLGKVVLLY